MAAPKFETCETESAGEEFEDVALLLESNLEQQSSRSSPSWKDKLMSYFARGNARSHTGFEKLDQSDDVQEGSHRTQGTGCLHFKQQQTRCALFPTYQLDFLQTMQCSEACTHMRRLSL